MIDNAELLHDIARKLKYRGPGWEFDDESKGEPIPGVISAECDELDAAIWIQVLHEVADFLISGSEHYVVFSDEGWGLQHALDCREDYDGDLTLCPYHEAMTEGLYYQDPGRYRMKLEVLTHPDLEHGQPWLDDDVTFEKVDS